MGWGVEVGAVPNPPPTQRCPPPDVPNASFPSPNNFPAVPFAPSAGDAIRAELGRRWGKGDGGGGAPMGAPRAELSCFAMLLCWGGSALLLSPHTHTHTHTPLCSNYSWRGGKATYIPLLITP